jgi:hypothetical protein
MSGHVAMAQLSTGTTTTTSTTPTTSESTIISKTAAAGKVKCWIARTSTKAIAVHVFVDPTNSQLCARVRYYVKNDEEYASRDTIITLPSNTTPEPGAKFLTVKLVPFGPAEDRMYEMKFVKLTPTPTESSIGFLRFIKGSNGRTSDDVLMRFHGKASGTNAKVHEYGTDPCDKPPVDDVGEEEDMAMSGTSTNTPGPSLPIVPTPSTET